MRQIQASMLFYAGLSLLLLCTADTKGLFSPMRKRMDGSQRDDQLFFDNLHTGFFRHVPFPQAPSELDKEDMYPDTYFFNKQPIFFTDSDTPLSRNKLHEAFNYFGKVHVADIGTGRVLTIAPDTRGAELGPYGYDAGLDKFVRHIRAFERIYGPAVAAVAHGSKTTRSPTDRRSWSSTYDDAVPWETIKNARALANDPNLTPQQLRQRLRQDKFVKVGSKDGLSSVSLRFDEDGLLEGEIWGRYDPDLLDFSSARL
ncbi:uncharacterized protein SRS1_11235 [Sporisorium reilianum f. sp. reilianum]|uniref:Uncharacterized protein n=1 Tax=Sporisorium reilianum f. sp. reilianum TaxID=72559 RepID=A0A2N8UG98_9BASI|nr:uncharacterized protein SRS1_11235 [Sporisorium reilianum f. sp. reilianum]